MNSNKILSFLTLLLRPSVATSNRALQTSIALLRLIAGVVMVHNGLDKLGNVESFAQAYVAYIGLPFPIFFTYVAAFTELLGAPLLVLGLFTRPASLGLTFTMMVAMYHHIKVAGLSIPYLELSALYFAVFQFFTIAGPGLFSGDALLTGWLDNAMGGKTREAVTAPEQAKASV